MNRIEFMHILEQLLADLPENERSEAVQYYNDYLDDAGVENEQEVLEALGTPQALAASIREGLHEEKKNDGVFSERGFFRDADAHMEKPPAAYTQKPQDKQQSSDSRSNQYDRKKKKDGRNTGLLILTIICAVFAAPILIPLAIAFLAVVFSLAATAVIIAATFMIAGIVCIVAGLAALVVAIAKFAVVPAGAMVAAGICLMVIGIGILLVLLMGWILVRLIPAVCRGCVHLISRLFHRKPKGGHE